MTIIIFILVLAVLILVHEFGHFIVAKKSDMRVDEFGLGFPPKVFGYKPKDSETEYSLNWIPFGGFVKIFGENYDEESMDSKRSFVNKPAYKQAAVLAAGVVFNVLFAWLLFAIAFMSGMPTSAGTGQAATENLSEPRVMITSVMNDSPAEQVGLEVGDTILSLSNSETLSGDKMTVDSIGSFIAEREGEEITVTVNRHGAGTTSIAVTPATGVVEDQAAIGVSMNNVGLLKLPPHKAVYRSAIFTANMTKDVTIGLGDFFYRALTGRANFSQVAGPVGIAGLVGDAASLGLIHLMTFTAFISLHLAVINLVPFPALDGGRLVMVAIEKMKGSRIKPEAVNIVNTIGFALLILLMVVITYHDILRLF